jgi:small-conductance mechanosensitive channel
MTAGTRLTAARAIAVLFAILATGLQPAAAAQDDARPDIESRYDPGLDAEIETRLTGIFREISEFSRLEVEVREGVVTLRGEVASEAAIDRAERLAERLSGVVTVENRIERAVDVESNVSPVLDSLGASLNRLWRAWPVYVIALTAFVLIAGTGFLVAWPERLWMRLTPNPFVAGLVRQVIRIVFLAAALVTALSLIGAVALLGALAGGAGLAGLAIGFAVRDTIENYVASVMLSLRQPFRANDLVAINDREGRVIRLTSRATILMTLQGNHLRIPNSDVFRAVIVNFTRNPQRRFDFALGIGDDENAIEALETGLAAVRSLDFALAEPKPVAVIEEVGASNIVLRFMVWIDQRETDFAKARSLTIHTVKCALEAGGFTLPQPIYRLRFDEPLPAQEVRPDGRGKAAMPPPASVPAPGAFDVAPETDLAEKVEAERAGGREGDLLDDRRPVE